MSRQKAPLLKQHFLDSLLACGARLPAGEAQEHFRVGVAVVPAVQVERKLHAFDAGLTRYAVEALGQPLTSAAG